MGLIIQLSDLQRLLDDLIRTHRDWQRFAAMLSESVHQYPQEKAEPQK
jgi:hypothetical protein